MIENELEKMINILLSDKRETIVRFEQERFNDFRHDKRKRF